MMFSIFEMIIGPRKRLKVNRYMSPALFMNTTLTTSERKGYSS